MKDKELTSAFGLLPKSTEVIKRSLLTYFILLVIPLLLTSLTGETTRLESGASFKEVVDSVVDSITPFMVAGSLLSLIFFPALMYTELHSAAGKHVSLRDALKGYKYLWRLIGVAILTGLIVILGFLALIIPGFVMIRRYVLAPYFLIDKNMSVTEAMSAAARATKPVSWSIYAIILVLALFSIITGFGPIGLVAGTILQVLYSVAFALRYQEIKGRKI